MKTKLLHYFLLSGLLLLLSGCFAIINTVGLKVNPDDYVFTRPDGTRYRSWHLAKDKSQLPDLDKQNVKPFDLNEITRQYYTTKPRTYYELTVTDVKTIAAQNQLTFLALWHPSCQAAVDNSTVPFLDMVKKLEQARLQFNYGKVGVVLASVSYDMALMDRLLLQHQFPYQSYIIPAGPYSYKVLLKNIFFIKELCPECWEREKDDIADYTVFMLDPDGKVIDKLPAPGDQKFYADELNRMADYAIKTNASLKAAR